ncbi:hemin uptake protein HemP [Hydrogenophaga sp. 5NK40-0174]|uniref:hemin uptake protein HemP n=1 Tax=Hydrogenophaga sp. 5NK40-0174 TaxID=3127649 RepID=UPI00333E59F6
MADSQDNRPAEAPNAQPPLLNSQNVLQGHKSVVIEHNGSTYRLQTTRQGKLILTK